MNHPFRVIPYRIEEVMHGTKLEGAGERAAGRKRGRGRARQSAMRWRGRRGRANGRGACAGGQTRTREESARVGVRECLVVRA